MARFLAMRVSSGKLDYNDVPERFKSDVHEALISEFGWTEDSFGEEES